MFYDRFIELCEKKGVSRTKACTDCNVSRTAWRKWADGATPNGTTLNSFSSYFGVSVGYLLGEAEQKEKAPANAEAYVNDDPELTEYLEELKNRNEMRMLFKLAKNATKADVMRAVAIIEALRKEDND